MSVTVPGPQPLSLAGFAEYLAIQQKAILEQWLLIVNRDTQIESADRMPHRELIDHLPRLLQELCEFLRARDADMLTGEVRRDASSHGELRRSREIGKESAGSPEYCSRLQCRPRPAARLRLRSFSPMRHAGRLAQ